MAVSTPTISQVRLISCDLEVSGAQFLIGVSYFMPRSRYVSYEVLIVHRNLSFKTMSDINKYFSLAGPLLYRVYNILGTRAVGASS